MKRWQKWFVVLFVCLLSFGSLGYLGMQQFSKAVHATDTFTPIDLGTTFTPIGISDSGIVAGNINDNSTYLKPAIWQAGSFTNLTSPSDVYGTGASGISPSGEVVGSGAYTYVTTSNGHAVKWSNGQPSTDLNGAPPNSNNCYLENSVSWTTSASAANDVGDIVGQCDGIAFDTFMAGYWPGGQPDTFTLLPDITNGVSKYTASGLNHNDDMVGWAGFYCPGATCNGQYETTHAVFWKNGTANDINPSGSLSSSANAINDNDIVVGSVGFANSSVSHPYVWDLVNNHTYDLYTSMGIDGNLIAVNDSGLVIGYGYYDSSPNVPLVFMWKVGDARITDLNSLLPANSGWVLENAVGINSSGQIIGQGQLNGQSHAFLLNPSPSSSYNISLAPVSQTATIRGGQGLVTATLIDGATNAPVSNVKLSFSVKAGPNAKISGTCFPSSCTTDANGQVDWGYFGTASGIDVVQVWMDTNGNGVPDAGEPQTTATVGWTPPSTPGSSIYWAGYILTNMPHKPVSAVITVPTVPSSCTTTSHSSFWVGFNGALKVATSFLPQVGFDAACSTGNFPDKCTHTTPVGSMYYLWWEINPSTGQNWICSHPIAPGDKVYLKVAPTASKVIMTAVVNGTDTWSQTFTAPPQASYSTMECIAEDPHVSKPNGGTKPAPFADFGSVEFDSCSAILDYRARSTFTQNNIYTSLGKNGTVTARTSPITFNGSIFGFTVTRV